MPISPSPVWCPIVVLLPASCPPLNARVVTLGEGSTVVYYTSDPERADVVRVVSYLSPR
jgi:hypothetical protein